MLVAGLTTGQIDSGMSQITSARIEITAIRISQQIMRSGDMIHEVWMSGDADDYRGA